MYLIEGDKIQAYSAHDGSGLWTRRSPEPKYSRPTSDAVVAGRFLVAKYWGTTDADGDLFFIDNTNGRLERRMKLGKWCSPPVLLGDLASLVVREDSTYAIARVSPRSGKRLSMTPVRIGASSTWPWNYTSSYRLLARQSAAISANVWLTRDERWFVTLRAQPPGVLGMRWTGYPACSLPAGAGNRMFQSSVLPDGTLGVQALDLKGRVVWAMELPYAGGGIFSHPPTVHRGKVFVFDGATAYAVDAATGKLLWIRRASKRYGARDIPPFIFRGDLCVVPGGSGFESRGIVRINTRTGTIRSHYEAPGGIAALTPHRRGMVIACTVQRGDRYNNRLVLLR